MVLFLFILVGMGVGGFSFPRHLHLFIGPPQLHSLWREGDPMSLIPISKCEHKLQSFTVRRKRQHHSFHGGNNFAYGRDKLKSTWLHFEWGGIEFIDLIREYIYICAKRCLLCSCSIHSPYSREGIFYLLTSLLLHDFMVLLLLLPPTNKN